MITYTPPAGLVRYEFSDGGYWYKAGGTSVRSISRILQRIYPLPPDLDPWYLERGKAVHLATTYVDAGSLGDVDPRILPFVRAYQDFVGLVQPVMEAVELVVIHPSCAYGARIDRVMRLPGQRKLVVTDIKCGSGQGDNYWLQVAGCAMALDEDHIDDYELALLNLRDNGRASFTVAADPSGWVNRWRKVLEEDPI